VGYYTGGLIAVGTQGSPITFTSVAASPQPGDWYGIRFNTNTLPETKLDWCVVEYGGGTTGYPGCVYIEEETGVEIADCTIRNSKNVGIGYSGTGHVKNFTGNTITGCAEYAVSTLPEYLREFGTGNTLSGNTVEGIGVDDGAVTTTGTWRNQGVPYILLGDVSIESTAQPVVTIEPGTTIRAASGCMIRVGYSSVGGLVADGTLGQITFTSSAPPLPWDGLRFYSYTKAGSVLKNCLIEYGGGIASYPGNIYINGTSAVDVTGCTIQNGLYWGIYLTGTTSLDLVTLKSNNTFSGNVSGDVYK
jgi:hypothetical protein